MSVTSSVPLSASVIVPVYNGARTLDACLSALSSQTPIPGPYEIIVVDDGSTDGSAELAARHGARVIRQERQGAAAARNAGAQRAQGEILLFTDADCEPLPDWLAEMAAPLARPEVAGVKGIYQTRQDSLVARFVQAEYEEKYDRLAMASRIDFVDTYAAAYRREVFVAIGGFDTSYPAATVEDQEFSYRVAEGGFALVFAPGARVYHQHTATVWRYFRRKAQIGRWKVRVHLYHPGKALQDSYTPWTQKAQLLLLPLGAALVVGAGLGLVSWAFAGIGAGLGFITTAPLVIKAKGLGWPVAVAAPALALVRALALDLGMGWGLVSLGRSRLLRSASRDSRQSHREQR
jgi:glycosyltransferase involved in cell wall biosynthesis